MARQLFRGPVWWGDGTLLRSGGKAGIHTSSGAGKYRIRKTGGVKVTDSKSSQSRVLAEEKKPQKIRNERSLQKNEEKRKNQAAQKSSKDSQGKKRKT